MLHLDQKIKNIVFVEKTSRINSIEMPNIPSGSEDSDLETDRTFDHTRGVYVPISDLNTHFMVLTHQKHSTEKKLNIEVPGLSQPATPMSVLSASASFSDAVHEPFLSDYDVMEDIENIPEKMDYSPPFDCSLTPVLDDEVFPTN